MKQEGFGPILQETKKTVRTAENSSGQETGNSILEKVNVSPEITTRNYEHVMKEINTAFMQTPRREPNTGKKLEISVNGETYERFPVKTPVIRSGDNVAEILKELIAGELTPNDMVFVSEKIIAISQGRAYKISDIKPSALANFLVRFVHKSKHGIGLGSPWTMELALKEAGAPRILLAAAASAITKPFGMKGVFYHVAGNNVNAIDGPCDYTLPPYNEYAKLGPKNPDKEAEKLSQKLGVPVVIIDANDLGVNILGKSSKLISEEQAKALFKDNPLGQASEQTPAAIVRKVN